MTVKRITPELLTSLLVVGPLFDSIRVSVIDIRGSLRRFTASLLHICGIIHLLEFRSYRRQRRRPVRSRGSCGGRLGDVHLSSRHAPKA